jgi:hypothetical protein
VVRGDVRVPKGDASSRLVTTVSQDPGDETERNFRYQHQYGVVLLAAVRRGVNNYVALYCEHHEDFLAERPDGRFDCYQIKTSKPENGAWTLTSPPLTRSIGRFLDLMEAFPNQIGTFVFVSNSDIDSVTPVSKDDRRRGRCPGLMLDHVKSCVGANSIQPPFSTTFNALAAQLGADRGRLFDVLKRLEIVKGPSREDFDASLAQEHVGILDECSHLAPEPLRSLCNELVARFHRAASLYVVDPNRHLAGFASGTSDDPVIAAKRIVCSEVNFTPRTKEEDPFRYQGPPTIKVGQLRPKHVLERKLTQGGVDSLIDYMKVREQSAEYHFLEEQAKDPVVAARRLRQVEEAVHGECLESFIAAQTSGSPFGQAMFTDVSSRLRRLETGRKGLLEGAPYELLMGTAALLTSDCRVWWSDRFQIDGGEG